MTASDKADARALLSRSWGSLATLRGFGSFAGCGTRTVPRRRMMKMEIVIRSVVIASAGSNWEDTAILMFKVVILPQIDVKVNSLVLGIEVRKSLPLICL